jgi:hypothetical protein
MEKSYSIKLRGFNPLIFSRIELMRLACRISLGFHQEDSFSSGLMSRTTTGLQ